MTSAQFSGLLTPLLDAFHTTQCLKNDPPYHLCGRHLCFVPYDAHYAAPPPGESLMPLGGVPAAPTTKCHCCPPLCSRSPLITGLRQRLRERRFHIHATYIWSF